ncbi:hypothetical protein KKA50_01595, partial [Patescibacteria group bacterium]|nr:hypothetical protein [Patescibacteria group bacterium]
KRTNNLQSETMNYDKKNPYKNKNPYKIRTATANFVRGYDIKPSFLNSTKDNPEEAMYRTIVGTLNLIEKKNTGRLDISDEDIEKGIEANAQRLGISIDDYHEKMEMITDPKPEENPESDSDISTETTEPRM